MLEILQFIFSNFWIFCGTVILLYIIGVYCITSPIAAILCAFSKDSKDKDN
ncbi:hypothetical protein AMURIS_04213 [Acetatifactor muris]|uniref:Uncharacterized protein n=1 Tax=Acetatifactor muris TaxID=879566 RepID=A0A2K4ZLZ5_9FIRM|nr:hypothetical protein AMURIS_04213 [Acetatifactor muris]